MGRKRFDNRQQEDRHIFQARRACAEIPQEYEMDEETKKDYKDHLLYHRRRKEVLGYGNAGLQYFEYQDNTGLIPQIEKIFRSVIVKETELELERKVEDIRDPLMRKRTMVNCRKCQDIVLTEFDAKFREYYSLLADEKINEIPINIFKHRSEARQ